MEGNDNEKGGGDILRSDGTDSCASSDNAQRVEQAEAEFPRENPATREPFEKPPAGVTAGWFLRSCRPIGVRPHLCGTIFAVYCIIDAVMYAETEARRSAPEGTDDAPQRE